MRPSLTSCDFVLPAAVTARVAAAGYDLRDGGACQSPRHHPGGHFVAVLVPASLADRRLGDPPLMWTIAVAEDGTPVAPAAELSLPPGLYEAFGCELDDDGPEVPQLRPVLAAGAVLHDDTGDVVAVAVSEKWAATLAAATVEALTTPADGGPDPARFDGVPVLPPPAGAVRVIPQRPDPRRPEPDGPTGRAIELGVGRWSVLVDRGTVDSTSPEMIGRMIGAGVAEQVTAALEAALDGDTGDTGARPAPPAGTDPLSSVLPFPSRSVE